MTAMASWRQRKDHFCHFCCTWNNVIWKISTWFNLVSLYYPLFMLNSEWNCWLGCFSKIFIILTSFLAWIPWNLSFRYILFHEKRLQTMLWHHDTGVNSHQRWKQTRFRVCFHLWCELTITMNDKFHGIHS